MSVEQNIIGHKGSSSSSSTVVAPKEAANTLASNTIARIIDLIGEGPLGDGAIGPLVNGLKSVFYNKTALQNADGTMNFTGVTIDTRSGTPNQSYIPGFPSVENEIAVGLQVVHSTPVVRTITDPNTTAALIKIRIPALSAQNTKTGDLNGTSVSFNIDLQSNGGGFTTQLSETISGKTTSAYEVEYRVPLPAGGAPWDLRVNRTTPDATSVAVNNQTYWSTYTQVIDHQIQYVDSALIGTEINAEQFGGDIPDRAYEVYGVKIQVPVNYDPVARTYTGLWNGSFKTAWSNNPAWVLYDLMTNSRYGIGMTITASQIDKYALYTIAKYCDELVPDGAGGMEPRYVFNGIINTMQDAYTVLSAVASTFRGMLYWGSGVITASADMPGDYVKLITPANIIEGTFNYQGSSFKTRHSVASVRWNDPANFYDAAVVAYEDPDLIQIMGWKSADVNAYGCTSKGQAFRQGRWFLNTERYETELVTYKASFDNADLRPGQIIAVADPTYAGVRFGGRIAAATTTDITLDAPVTLTAGETYTLSVILPDGTVANAVVTNSPGANITDLTLSAPLASAPNTGAMWILAGTNVAPRLFRVISIVESEKNIFEVTALYYDATKYARVEQNINLTPKKFSLLPTGPMPAPTNMSRVEYLYLATNGQQQSAITLSWTASADPRATYYQVQMMRPTTTYFENVDSSSKTSIEITGLVAGTYQFQVRAVDAFGQTSPWLVASFTLLGQTLPPDDVTNFRINNVGSQSNLTWSPVTSLNLAYYVIKFSAKTDGTAKWGESTILVPQVASGAAFSTVPTLIGTYLIKAISTAEVESNNETVIVSNIGDVSQNNVVETITEDSAFSGAKTNVQVISGALKLIDLTMPGYYNFQNTFDLGEVFTSRVIPSLSAFGEDTSDTMSTWTTLAGVSALSVVDPSSWLVAIQIRTTNDDPTVAPVWSDWNDLIIGDYTCRAYQFRAVLTSIDGNTNATVEKLAVTVDMPDRLERNNDVLTDSGGQYIVAYAYPFRENPSVQAAGQNMQSGDYYTTTDKTESGFTINFFNASGTGVQRTFDWLSSGFGRKL